jgi:hypothetical protein
MTEQSGDLHPADCWCRTCKEEAMDGEPVYRFDKELEAEVDREREERRP